jgi:hypothetical protein
MGDEMTFREAATAAVKHADADGREDREQAALSWLWQAGYMASLTCDERLRLECEVREVLFATPCASD